MVWLATKRIFKSGLQNFVRSGFVSLSSVLVMLVTLFIIISIFLLGGFLNYSLDQVKNKVDVNVYFVTTANENDVLTIKKSLEALPEVSSVEYISSSQALANFKEKHQGDDLTLQALTELGTNPLGATLNVKSKDPSQYAGIAKYLDDASNAVLAPGGTSIIDKVNYAQNKIVIDKLSAIVNSVNVLGIWLAIIFILISLIVTFNTIRLTIFMARDEISVMRLVGASSNYVKGPFVVSGVLCGLISVVIVLIGFSFLTFSVNHYYGSYFMGFDLFYYYLNNFAEIFAITFASGLIIGSLASYWAAHKYLRH
jgi:cell division transport system permease protein